MKISIDIIKHHDHVELCVETTQGIRSWSARQRFDQEPGHAEKAQAIGTLVLELMEIVG